MCQIGDEVFERDRPTEKKNIETVRFWKKFYSFELKDKIFRDSMKIALKLQW